MDGRTDGLVNWEESQPVLGDRMHPTYQRVGGDEQKMPSPNERKDLRRWGRGRGQDRQDEVYMT